MKNQFILSVFMASLFSSEIAVPQHILNGAFVKETNITRDPITYAHLREADVTWSKRIWRKLDLREKINHPFYFPTEEIKDIRSLVQVIVQSVKEGSLTAYDPLSDEFSLTLTRADVLNKLTYVDTTWVPGPEPPYEPEMVIVEEPFDYGRVKEIRLMED